jgi:hypothetical protein
MLAFHLRSQKFFPSFSFGRHGNEKGSHPRQPRCEVQALDLELGARVDPTLLEDLNGLLRGIGSLPNDTIG